jgi:pimeloyl-ACP methyl ester carboxylesterase
VTAARAAQPRLTGPSRRLAIATLILVPLLTLVGCAGSVPPPAPIVATLPDVPAEVWESRGQLVHQESFDDPPLGDPDTVLGQAWKAVYRSVSGVDGGMREISGSFFIPSGSPPKGGWPVVSLAHGTVGIGNNCGPSRQPDLQGYGFMIEGLLQSKYAVALTDYEGLGASGSHPYLEPRTEAFNTIDAVRALRNLTPAVSASWIGIGYSQGGQAVWAANELNSYYGNGLQLQGSVALAPATNLSSAADLVLSKSMTEEQRALFPTVIVGLARYNSDLDPRAFLHESTQGYQKSLSRCQPRRGHTRKAVPAPVPWEPVAWRVRESNDLQPNSSEDVDKLKEVLRRVAIPERALSKPMLVISARHDAVVFPEWVWYAVARSCALGGQIKYVEADATHEDILWKVSRIVDRWVTDRFADAPAPSSCPAPKG